MVSSVQPRDGRPGVEHVMTWHRGDGPWGDEAVRRYVRGGYNGLSLSLPSSESLKDLRFLADLPRLRFVSVNAKVADDSAVFSLAELETLTLVTGSRRPLPDHTPPRLRTLVIVDRRGLGGAGGEVRWPALTELQVGAFRREDTEWLASFPALELLRLEARKQAVDVSGVRHLSHLRKLVVVNAGLNGLEAFRELHNVEELDLMATARSAGHGVVDLAHVAKAPLRRLWIGHAEGLRNVEALLSVSTLRSCRLIACQPSDADRTVLAELAARQGAGRCHVEVLDR